MVEGAMTESNVPSKSGSILELLSQVPRISGVKLPDGAVLMVGTICNDARREIERLSGPGNATQAQLDAATKPLHVEIERLRAALKAAKRWLPIEVVHDIESKKYPPDTGYSADYLNDLASMRVGYGIET